jgi:hypothetical protein
MAPLKEPPTHWKEPLIHQHSCSDCASCEIIHDLVVILNDLVFSIHKYVDDLHFWLELLEKRGEQIVSMLSTFIGTQHSPEMTTSAMASSTTFMAPVIQAATTRNMGQSDISIA